MGGFEALPDPVPAAQMVYDEVGRELILALKEGPNTFSTEINAGDFL